MESAKLGNCHSIPVMNASVFSRRGPLRCPKRLLDPGRRQRGLSLVEVLVAIVVLSFGLLGMVGMQAFSLQATQQARLQGRAASLARELAEMMRGNKVVGTVNDATNNPYLGAFAVGSLSMGSNASYCLNVGNASSGCSSVLEVAKAEMTDWLARVDMELPGARVSVCFDAAPYDASGMPVWSCTAASADQTTAVIKIGWTRASTDNSKTDSSALENASTAPYLIFPVTSGNAASGT